MKSKNSAYFVLLSMTLLTACGKISNQSNSKMISAFSVDGKRSIEGITFEPNLFTGMGYQSDKIKILVAENLQFHFQQNALEEYLNGSLNMALRKNNKPQMPDVFSFVMKPLSEIRTPYDKNSTTAAIKEISRIYSDERKVISMVRTGKEVLTSVIDLPIIGKAINKFGDHIIDSQADSAHDLYTKLTADYLKKTVNIDDADKLNNLSNSENAAYIAQKYNTLENLNKYACEANCSDEQKQMITDSVQGVLITLSKNNTENTLVLSTQIKSQSDKTEKIQNDLIKFKKDSDALNTEIKGRMDDLATSQNELNEKFTNLSSQVNETRKDIGLMKDDVRFLKDFMFSKMSVNEKLAALKSGSYGTTLVKEKRELLEKQLDFQSKIQSASQTLTGINTILNNLGINNPELNKAAEYANVASSLANSLLSPTPDYFSAAMTITGVFAKSKDAAAERQEQIMNKLGKMDEKLDKILSTQVEIYNLQITTVQMIADVSKKLDIVQDQIDSALLGLKINRQGISELLNKPIDSCNQFIQGLNEDLNNRVGFDNFTNSYFTPYRVRQDHFDTFKNQFSNCDEITTQLSLISTQAKVSQTLLVAYDSNRDSNNNGNIDSDKYYYLKFIYPNHFNFFNHIVSNISNKTQRIDALRKYIILGLGEYKGPKELYEKYNFLFATSEGQKQVDTFFKDPRNSILGEMDDVQLLNALKDPISKDAIFRITDILNQVFYYFDIVKNGNMPELKELLVSNGRGLNSKGYLALKNLYAIQTLSQVQSLIENGFLEMPFIYDNFSNNDIITTFNSIIDKDKNFQENFKNFLLVNKAYKASKINLYRQFENIETAKYSPVQLFDNRLDSVLADDQRSTNLDSINLTLGFKNSDTTYVDYREKVKGTNGTETNNVFVVVKYQNDKKENKEILIPLSHFKTSAENLWMRDSSYESVLKATYTTLATMLSYTTELKIYNESQDRNLVYAYTKLLLGTPVK